jgi:ABC-2 type transport system permease protein
MMRPTIGRTRLAGERRPGHDHHDPACSSRRGAFPSRPVRPLGCDLARSEWVKLRTVRSTYWTLLLTVVGMAGFGALLTAAYARHYAGVTAAARRAFDPAAYSLSGFFLAQLAIGVLGVLVITGEYATGSIRSTFAAAPQRTSVLTAKAAVSGVVAAVTGIASSFAAFFIGQALLAGKGIGATIGGPGALRMVIGTGFYLAVLGLLALGLGTLIRRTAGAIAAVIGLIIILPVLVQGLPPSWQAVITRSLPSVAGQVVIGRTKFAPPGQLLSPWTGFALFCAYTAVVLFIAAVTLTRRDAPPNGLSGLQPRQPLYEITGDLDASRRHAHRDVDGVCGVALCLGTVERHFRAVPGELVAARRQVQPEPAVVTGSHCELSARRAHGHHLSRHRSDPDRRPAKDQRARHGSTMAGEDGLMRGASGHGGRDGQC